MAGSWYQGMQWPVPSQVTSRHGYWPSHRKIRAASVLGMVVATASSILAPPSARSPVCSMTGIRWQLMPTVDRTV